MVRNKEKIKEQSKHSAAAAIVQNRWVLATFSRKREFFFQLLGQLNNDNSCGYRHRSWNKKRKRNVGVLVLQRYAYNVYLQNVEKTSSKI